MDSVATAFAKEGELAPELFAFLTSEPNAEVATFTLAAPCR
jgi:hypothetical protein